MFWCTTVWLENINLAKKIELTRQHFHSIIFYNFGRGLSRQECIDEPKSLYGKEAPSSSSVKNRIPSWPTLAKRRRPWRSFKNSRCSREHWCRAWTDGAISSWDIPWDRGILGHFFHQHTSVKKICSCCIPRNLTNAQKRFLSIGVKKCWKNTMAVLQKTFIR